jgi:hypothetical protein
VLLQHLEELDLIPAGATGKTVATAAAGAAAADVMLLAANSMTLTAANFSALGLPAFRMISVDGGHSLEITLHDLMLAACLVVDGGIVILDDYPNSSWQVGGRLILVSGRGGSHVSASLLFYGQAEPCECLKVPHSHHLGAVHSAVGDVSTR